MWRMLVSALVILVLALVLAACSGDDDAAPTPTRTPEPEIEATQLPFEERALEPGWYTNDDSTPRVAFELGEGWSGGHLLPEFYDVQRPELIVSFAHPTFIYERGAG
ncbi:MAG: hypothetical protein WEB00_15850 [Dehalococcoidia bacterium]